MLYVLTERGEPNGGVGVIKYLVKAESLDQAWAKAKAQIPYLNNTAVMVELEPFCHNDDVIKLFSFEDPHDPDCGG